MTIRERVAEIVSSVTNPVILELGAQHGSDTRWLRGLCRGPTTYVAVEPDERHVQNLRQVQGISLALVAIADHVGRIPFHLAEHPTELPASSSIRRPTGHLRASPLVTFPRSVSVPCETLDSLARWFGLRHVDLIWADIQGAEKDMVLGGRETLARTDWLFVESYEEEMYEGQAVRSEFLAMLSDWEVIQSEHEDILLRRKR